MERPELRSENMPSTSTLMGYIAISYFISVRRSGMAIDVLFDSCSL